MRESSAGPDRAPCPRLVNEQYSDDKRLRSRYLIHQRFSTAGREYLDWVFDHLLQCRPSRMFDLGCGTGYLWQRNAGRLPADWSLALGDRSPGMLAMAASRLQAVAAPIEYVQLDAGHLPFLHGRFDAVLCLHVLHHIQDVRAVLKEVKRVLENGATLLAATNGERHMHEVKQALLQFNLDTDYFNFHPGFNLQNGEMLLAELFERVDCVHFKDALHVTQVEPLLDYVRSGIPTRQIEHQRKAMNRLERHWQEELEREGVIRIEKQAGLFIAA